MSSSNEQALKLLNYYSGEGPGPGGVGGGGVATESPWARCPARELPLQQEFFPHTGFML